MGRRVGDVEVKRGSLVGVMAKLTLPIGVEVGFEGISGRLQAIMPSTRKTPARRSFGFLYLVKGGNSPGILVSGRNLFLGHEEIDKRFIFLSTDLAFHVYRHNVGKAF